MKNGCYLFLNQNYNKEINSSGVSKKIEAQLGVFNTNNFTCTLINMWDYQKKTKNKLSTLLSFFDKTKFESLKLRSYDYMYIRYHFPIEAGFINLLAKAKEKNRSVKIIMEIPTYPYVKELISVKQKIFFLTEKIFIGKLKHYVDRIASFSKDERIFSIPTIQITNGVDLSKIPIVKKKEKKENEINLIAVAQFGPWHGYDRLIKGLNLYYKNHQKTKTYLHLIGDGKELDLYKKHIIDNKLEDYIYIHGKKFGNELTEIFNTADIAISSLGNHRKKLFLSSELKSREYLARALPIVSSTKIDIIPEGFPYCHYVPEDESPIDIEALIQFYKNLQNEKNYTKKIRAFAEEHVGMDKTMQPIFKYIETTL